MEGLQYSVKGGEEHDAREQEGDLAGPGGTVERGVDVAGEESNEVRDGVGVAAIGGGCTLLEQSAPEDVEGCCEDPIDAVAAEAERESVEKATSSSFRSLLLGKSGFKDGKRGLEGR